VITWPAAGISRQGQHEHLFFNPAGVAFEIRCFLRAPGCLVQGRATAEFSWFSGYLWRYAHCSTCLTHLGWRFASSSDTFFALIANRLID